MEAGSDGGAFVVRLCDESAVVLAAAQDDWRRLLGDALWEAIGFAFEATISALCTRRSTRETTQAVFAKTSFHSPNARLVVISVLLF